MKKHIILLFFASLFASSLIAQDDNEAALRDLLKYKNEEIEKLSGQNQSLNDTINKLRDDIDSLISVKEKLENDKDELLEYGNKVTSLQSKNASLNDSLSSLNKMIKSYKRKYNKLKVEEGEVDSIRKKVKSLENYIRQLENDFNANETAYQKSNKQFNDSITKLNAVIAENDKIIKAHNEDKKKLAKEQELLKKDKKDHERIINELNNTKKELDIFIIDVIIACLDNPCKDETINKLIKYYDGISSDSVKVANENFRKILLIYTDTKKNTISLAKQCIENYNKATSEPLRKRYVNEYFAAIEALEYVSKYYNEEYFYSLYLNRLIPNDIKEAYKNAKSLDDTKKHMNNLINALKEIVDANS